MFCIYLRTNSDLCHLQLKLIGFYNRGGKCLQRGTDRFLIQSRLRLVCKSLKLELVRQFSTTIRFLTLPPLCAVVMKSGNLNFLEPSGPLQACNWTDSFDSSFCDLLQSNVHFTICNIWAVFAVSLAKVSRAAKRI